MNISISKSLKLWKKKIELSWRFKFAHHPLCNKYRSHLFVIGKKKQIYICQGCSLAIIGIIISLMTQITLYFFNYLLDIHNSIIMLNILFLPTLLVESNSSVEFIKTRTAKRVSRLLAGMDLGILFFVIFNFQSFFILKLIISINSLAAFILFRYLRKGKTKKDLCENCIELKKHEICSGLKLESIAMKKYSEYATKLLYSDLEYSFQTKYLKKLNENK